MTKTARPRTKTASAEVAELRNAEEGPIHIGLSPFHSHDNDKLDTQNGKKQ